VSGAKIYGREIHGGPARMAGWAGGPGHVTPMLSLAEKGEANKSQIFWGGTPVFSNDFLVYPEKFRFFFNFEY